MYKILDGIKQLKGATLAIEEVVNIVSIVSVDVFGETSIHVKTLRDLEQIPGELELVKVGYGSCYQFEARKIIVQKIVAGPRARNKITIVARIIWSRLMGKPKPLPSGLNYWG